MSAGEPLKEGNCISIYVDQIEGSIKWEINGKSQVKYYMERLKDKTI